MRSVYGMQEVGTMEQASGFRSMVVAQFTGVSLQKDDRAFVKYDKTSRGYSGIPISKDNWCRLIKWFIINKSCRNLSLRF